MISQESKDNLTGAVAEMQTAIETLGVKWTAVMDAQEACKQLSAEDITAQRHPAIENQLSLGALALHTRLCMLASNMRLVVAPPFGAQAEPDIVGIVSRALETL